LDAGQLQGCAWSFFPARWACYSTWAMELRSWKERVEAALPGLVPENSPQALREAMLYSLLAGGKRFRPLLALATAKAVGGKAEDLVEASCALEFIHTYSLIHDDLPAMDNDTLRRGMPTSHVKFGEALAILAGDALNTEAFRILAMHPAAAPPEIRLEAVRILAEAAGAEGMAGGQVLDMRAPGPSTDEADLLAVHTGKTARLIQASVLLGALHGGARRETYRKAAEFGLLGGVLFQLADDVLDETATAEEMGKSPGKDKAQDKLTAPRVYGLEGAVRKARAMERECLALLDSLGGKTSELTELLGMICRRLPAA
jgi:geranylgeranyl pyrophosphate synthase